MVSWTTSCDEPRLGEIFSWDPKQFNLTNTEEVETSISEVNSKDLCLKENDEKHVLEFFEDGVGTSTPMSEESCERVNGKLHLVPQEEEEAFAVIKEYEDT